MGKRLFELKEVKGMIISVCNGYAAREEIQKEFMNYPENKKFTGEELKEIVKKLTSGKNKHKIEVPKEQKRIKPDISKTNMER